MLFQNSEMVGIKVMLTSSGNEYREETNDVFMCTSLDLSANGLQVVVNNIHLGSILRLCIDLADKDPIFLVGEVMWKRPDPGTDCIRFGFLVFESNDSNIKEWKLWVSNALN